MNRSLLVVQQMHNIEFFVVLSCSYRHSILLYGDVGNVNLSGPAVLFLLGDGHGVGSVYILSRETSGVY